MPDLLVSSPRVSSRGHACVCLTPDGTNSKNSVTPPRNSEGNRDLELRR